MLKLTIFKILLKRIVFKMIFFFLVVHSCDRTIDLIIKKNLSFVRFGDGELLWLANTSFNSFEINSEKLSSELKQCLSLRKRKDILFCINKHMFLKGHYPKEYYTYFFINHSEEILKFMPKFGFFGNACFTRYHLEKLGNNETLFYSKIKSLFIGKSILIVEGKGAKNGVGNDLFLNALSVKRILCPDKYAFEKIDLIEEAIRRLIDSFDCVCFGVGPTSKCLILRLISFYPNKRFYDLGFLDTDYLLFLNNKDAVCNVEGKTIMGSSTEFGSIFIQEDTAKYLSEIVAVIE